MRRALHAVIVLLVGCAGEPVDPPAESGPVIDHAAWRAVVTDPFDHAPPVVSCDRGVGWELEPLDMVETVSVETAGCNYLALEQPLLRGVATGEVFAVKLWNFELVGDGPAHAAIAIDGAVVWEKTIVIPRDAGLTDEEFTVPAGAALGAPVVFHLHNHGLNSWNLITIGEPD